MIKKTALVALLLVIMAAEPAAAEERALGLSLDGSSWQQSVERPLFAPGHVWVPGDIGSVSFWVRNESDGPASLYLELIDVRGTLRLGSQLRLVATVEGRPARLDAARRILTLPASGADPAQVRLTATIPEEVGNEAQRRSLSFRLRVTLQGQPIRPAPAPSDGPAPTDGPAPAPPTSGPVGLSATGAPVGTMPLIGLGLVLTAAGIAVMRGTRQSARRTGARS